MKVLYIALIILSSIANSLFAQQDNELVCWWKFDDIKITNEGDSDDLKTVESVSMVNFNLRGLTTTVPGVKGNAVKYDGFSSYIEGSPNKRTGRRGEDDDEEGFEFPRDISIEAWVSLGAYPWNWAPIVTIGKYKVTGFYFGIDSRGRVGFHVSDATSVWHECNSNLLPGKKWGMDLNKWYHVVGTYSPEKGLAIYVNGELHNIYTDFEFDYGIAYSDLQKGFRMGMNRQMLPPTDPIRDWATYPSRYTLDGIVDELKIYKKALSESEIIEIYNSVKPENPPQFHPRKFPEITSSGRFSANYTRLKFYPEWDAIWPVGDYMDVVVQFDEMPAKIMFWRGTRYSPCMVTEMICQPVVLNICPIPNVAVHVLLLLKIMQPEKLSIGVICRWM
jgi:hypothetical protein